VLDLVEQSGTFEGEAYDWICRAIGRRRTTADRLREAMAARPRMRWREDLDLALRNDKGALSVLEGRYVRGVERPHGLPAATRQARVWQGTGNRYLDNLYAEYRACVEIDGTAAHPPDEQWRDKDRDRWNAVHGKIDTIRIGMLNLRTPQAQCATAAEVARWLGGRGPRTGHPCAREGCPALWLPYPGRAGEGAGDGAGEGGTVTAGSAGRASAAGRRRCLPPCAGPR